MDTSPTFDSKGLFQEPTRPTDLAEQIPETLLAAWRAQIRRWCRRTVSGGPYHRRIDTSDVVQESLIQLWRDRARFRGASLGELRVWMFRIARGHLAKLRRYHRAEKRSIAKTDSLEDADASYSDDSLEPSQGMNLTERRLALSVALERLPESLAGIVKLRLFVGLSYREIGDQLGMSAPEARHGFLRALRRLRGLVSQWRED